MKKHRRQNNMFSKQGMKSPSQVYSEKRSSQRKYKMKDSIEEGHRKLNEYNIFKEDDYENDRIEYAQQYQ
jgi:hypothetical protein